MFLTFSSAKLGVLAFSFGTFAFGPVVLSGLVSLYFLAVTKKYSENPGGILPVELVTLGTFAALASLLLIEATFNWTGLFAGFGGMVIDPFLLFYKTLGFSDEFKNFDGGAVTFLSLAVLVPTMFGTICVVFASGAFHLVILQRVRPGNEGWEESFKKCTAWSNRISRS